MLLDEPTAALDIGHQQQALELLDGLREDDGLTLVAAMHDLTLAAQYADRVLLLSTGCIVADGTPAEVLTEAALAEHYGATVRVVTVDERLAVLPTRGWSRALEAACVESDTSHSRRSRHAPFRRRRRRLFVLALVLPGAASAGIGAPRAVRDDG